MAKKRRRFTPEFKREAVALVVDQGLSASPTISRWVRAAEEAAAPGALSTAEREELKRLREETKTLRMERDILKKAAAFFAKEM